MYTVYMDDSELRVHIRSQDIVILRLKFKLYSLSNNYILEILNISFFLRTLKYAKLGHNWGPNMG